jgi:hypothetical protein
LNIITWGAFLLGESGTWFWITYLVCCFFHLKQKQVFETCET